MGLPDRWLNYDRVGKPVQRTRFIAFKVPLKEGSNKGCKVSDDKQLYPKLLMTLVPNLGLVIDLTATRKYYNPDEFTKLDVEYKKIFVEGHAIPKMRCSEIFRETVNQFLEQNADNDKLIGVHCTHGLNRTGFILCRFMIEELGMSPSEAIEAFEEARGHKIERKNYLEALMKLKPNGGTTREILPSIAVDDDYDKGTQTKPGFWINESSIQSHHKAGRTNDSNSPEVIQKQVSLEGYVNVSRKDLIPDGRGGYFVHIAKKEIMRPDSHKRSRLSNPSNYQPSRSNGPYNQNAPYHSGPHSQYQNQSYRLHQNAQCSNAPYTQRQYGRDNSVYMDGALPMSMLRLQHRQSSGHRPNTSQQDNSNKMYTI